MNDFYVYALLRDEDGEPFYVGKGRGDRWLKHERKASQGEKSLKASIIRKVIKRLGYLPKEKLAVALTEDESFLFEKSLIAAIGRRPNGPLANLTDGGEGPAGYQHTEDQIRKMRNAWDNPVRLANFLLMIDATWSNPVIRETRITAVKNSWQNPETRLRRIKYLNDICWSNPVTITKLLTAVRESWRDPERRNKRLSSMKISLANPEVKKKKSRSSTSTWTDPEIRERRCDGMKVAWADEELSAKRSQAMKDGWARRRARLAAQINQSS